LSIRIEDFTKQWTPSFLQFLFQENKMEAVAVALDEGLPHFFSFIGAHHSEVGLGKTEIAHSRLMMMIVWWRRTKGGVIIHEYM
jgi:hypothetical protein